MWASFFATPFDITPWQWLSCTITRRAIRRRHPKTLPSRVSIVEAGKLLNIDVLDHIVIGGGRCVSLKERRLGMA